MFLSFIPLDAMEWYLMYVCGIFVRHVFVKGELVFLSFSQNKTSGLVAHENSTFKKKIKLQYLCPIYSVNGCSFGL